MWYARLVVSTMTCTAIAVAMGLRGRCGMVLCHWSRCGMMLYHRSRCRAVSIVCAHYE